MLDFSHIPDSPNVDIQKFWGLDAGGTTDWQTWRKPRGAKFVHMLVNGAGSSGGCGLNTGTTSGGGAGGGCGGVSSLLVPAMLVPDMLYLQCGAGGKQPNTLVSGAVPVAGGGSFISIEPSTTAILTFLHAFGGSAGTAAATTTAGGTATTISTTGVTNFLLASKGFTIFGPNGAGTAGGASTSAGVAATIPTTGPMTIAGAGGGGGAATAFAGGGFTQPTGTLGTNLFPGTFTGGTAGTGATPAGAGRNGFMTTSNGLMTFFSPAAGGGGGTTTSGGLAGAGGNGAPGCGGGGAGGSTSTAGANTLARPGNGGDGFIWIWSW